MNQCCACQRLETRARGCYVYVHREDGTKHKAFLCRGCVLKLTWVRLDPKTKLAIEVAILAGSALLGAVIGLLVLYVMQG